MIMGRCRRRWGASRCGALGVPGVMRGSSYRFPGFPEGQVPTVTLPALLFAELLPHLEDLDEVKVILHVLWRLAGTP